MVSAESNAAFEVAFTKNGSPITSRVYSSNAGSHSQILAFSIQEYDIEPDDYFGIAVRTISSSDIDITIEPVFNIEIL